MNKRYTRIIRIILFCTFAIILMQQQRVLWAGGEDGTAVALKTSASELLPRFNLAGERDISMDGVTVPEARLKADMSILASAVRPGDTVDVTIQLTNEGTAAATSAPFDLYFSPDLSLQSGQKIAGLTSEETGTVLTSNALNPGESQSWTLIVEVARAATQYQYVSLYRPRGAEAHIEIPIIGAEPLTQANANSLEGGSNDPGETPEAWLPRFVEPQISPFSAAATYGYGFDVAPGRGGLQPNIGISYSSRNTDATNVGRDSGDVAEGWNLTGIPVISRDEVQPCQYAPQKARIQNVFTLTLNGATYELEALDGTEYGRYEAKDAPGLYVARHNDLGTAAGYGGSNYNITSEYWIVRTTDGTTYWFGFDYDSEQIVYDLGGPNEECTYDDDNLAYNGEEGNVAVTKWWLDQVKDINGNIMELTYHNSDNYETTRCRNTGAPGPDADMCREVMEYIDTIAYNNTVAGQPGNYLTVVEFVWDSGSPVYFEDSQSLIFLTGKYRLNSLNIKHNGQILWSYNLERTMQHQFGGAAQIVTLDSIRQIFAGEDPLDPELPPVTFTYEDRRAGQLRIINWDWNAMDCVESSENYDFPYLKRVNNGYGGVHEFTYDDDYFETWSGYGPECSIYNNFPYSIGGPVNSHIVTDLKAWDGVEHIYGIDPEPTTWLNHAYNPNDACFGNYGQYAYDGSGFVYQDSCQGDNLDSPKLVGFDQVRTEVREGDGTALSHTWTNFDTDDSRLIGQVEQTRQYDPDNTGFSLAETTYTRGISNTYCPSDGLHFSFVCTYQVDTWQDHPVSNVSIHTQTVSYYDPDNQSGAGTYQWGVPTKQEVYVEGTKENASLTFYTADTNKWLLRPTQQDAHNGTAGVIGRTYMLYDNNMDPYNQTLTKGQLTLSRSLVSFNDIDPDPNKIIYESVDTGFAYGAFGNQTQVIAYGDYGRYGVEYGTPVYYPPTDPRVTETQYKANGLQIDWVRNPLLQQTTINSYDPSFFWLTTQMTGPNGVVVDTVYDDLARAVEVKRNGVTTLEYFYRDLGLPGFQRIGTWRGNGETRELLWFDGLGRTVQTSSKNQETNQYLRSSTLYDALGRPIETFTPFYTTPSTDVVPVPAGQPSSQTIYHDALGRHIESIAIDGSVSHQYFMILNDVRVGEDTVLVRTQTVDANGHQTNYYNNGLGQLVLVRDRTGVPNSYEDYGDTQYQYDAAGNLLAVLQREPDNLGQGPILSQSSMTYDLLGRKLTMNDADMGSWTYRYDAFSNLTEQTDALNQTLCFYYDVLNRMEGKAQTTSSCPDEFNSVPSNDVLAAYNYYSSGSGTGMLQSLSWGADPANNYDSFVYDSNGRLISQTRTIDGQPYTMNTLTFDGLDRPLDVAYPDNEIVSMTYDFWGEDSLVAGGDTLVSSIDHNEMGQMRLLERGNGFDTTYTYYPATGPAGTGDSNFRLQVATTTGMSGNLLDFEYHYDPVGNIESITDAVAGDTQSFDYDDLNRLTIANGTGGTGIPGYSEVYGYNEIGNIEAKGGLNYDYDTLQPHAVDMVHGSFGVLKPVAITLEAECAGIFCGESLSTGGETLGFGAGTGCVYFCVNVYVNGAFQQTLAMGVGQTATTFNLNVTLSGKDVITLQRTDTQADDLYLNQLSVDGTIIPSNELVWDGGNAWDGQDVSVGGNTFAGQGAFHWVSGEAGRFAYDANGNMTFRQEADGAFVQSFDIENRLVAVTDLFANSTTQFSYDASGQRTWTMTPDGTVTHYPFATYEVIQSGSGEQTTRSTYGVAGQTIAQRQQTTFLEDNFDDANADGWTAQSGSWSVVMDIIGGEGTDYSYLQSSTSGSPYSNTPLEQDTAIIYEWQTTFQAGSRRAGLFFFASDNSSANHGDAYLVRQHGDSLRLYESINNTLTLRQSVSALASNGQTHQYKVSYDPSTGLIKVWRDGVWLIDWTDGTPLTGGSYLGLHTNGSSARFDDIVVNNEALNFLYTDHLGSTTLMTDWQGTVLAGSEARYLPFGKYRGTAPTPDLTELGFTGHHENRDIGLTYMNARFYLPGVGRFASADTIIPDPGNSQAYNRYSYVINSPIVLFDPSGHRYTDDGLGGSYDCYSLSECQVAAQDPVNFSTVTGVVRELERMTGDLWWENPAYIQNGDVEFNDFFEHFALQAEELGFDLGSSCNCWESLLYAAYQAGAIDRDWIIGFYTYSYNLGEGNPNPVIWEILGADTATITNGDIPYGSLVFFTVVTEDALGRRVVDPYPGHVALSTGGDNILSLWSIPADQVQATTIQAIQNGLIGTTFSETNSPVVAVIVSYAPQPWAYSNFIFEYPENWSMWQPLPDFFP